MEVDDFQTQVCKFRRVSSNGSTSTDNSSNYEKIGTDTGNLQMQNHVGDGGDGDGGGGGGGRGVGGGIGRIDGGLGRFCGWPSSRIVRVSRASGGKDRHSKVLTSKGLRDRRVRLSVGTAIQFYDLQDRLGFDQPSKAVEWLIKAASRSIDELPSLDPAFTVAVSDQHNHRNHQTSVEKKSPACSSTSETSKGNSELSLSRSENQIKARVKSRIKERDKVSKEKEIDSPRVTVTNQVGSIPESENSSFTDLLTGGINTVNIRSPMDNFFNRYNQTSPQLIQIPQFNLTTGDNHHNFSFLNDSFLPGVGNSGEGERHSLNFLMTSSSGNGGGAVAHGGFSRGTLQSNLQYHSASTDGSTSTNLPFFFVPNSTVEHFPATGGFHVSYGGGVDGSGRQPEHHREKAKN